MLILGFLIDLTPPRAVQLFDGANPHLDEPYQTSTNMLSASWIMADPQSGIKEYRLSILATIQGSTTHFYPDKAPDVTIKPQVIGESDVLTCWSLNIQLSSGTMYAVRLTPINRADLSTVYTSSGIIPDSTNPIMDFIRIDTHGDESEERNEENAVSCLITFYSRQNQYGTGLAKPCKAELGDFIKMHTFPL